MAALPPIDGVLLEQFNDDAGYFFRGGKLIEKVRSANQHYEVWAVPSPAARSGWTAVS